MIEVGAAILGIIILLAIMAFTDTQTGKDDDERRGRDGNGED